MQSLHSNGQIGRCGETSRSWRVRGRETRAQQGSGDPCTAGIGRPVYSRDREIRVQQGSGDPRTAGDRETRVQQGIGRPAYSRDRETRAQQGSGDPCTAGDRETRAQQGSGDPCTAGDRETRAQQGSGDPCTTGNSQVTADLRINSRPAREQRFVLQTGTGPFRLRTFIHALRHGFAALFPLFSSHGCLRLETVPLSNRDFSEPVFIEKGEHSGGE